MEEVRLIFVLQKNRSHEEEVGEAMSEAYEACKQTTNMSVLWVKEAELNSATVKKTDFVVFEEFSGEAFESVKTTKCVRILGPWAIRICLMEAKPIPNFTYPIYNVAMYNCVITCSNLPNSLKIEIKDKVEQMGGCCMKTLVERTTHLVTNTVKSEKYLKAAEADVKLMTPSWVEEVWKMSQNANIHGNDEQFNQFRCLPFSCLTIVTTGLSSTLKKNVEKLVKENGGIYTGHLSVKDTDFLICNGDLSSSEKFQTARRKSIKCVTLDWIYDSIAKGYALPHTDYQIQKNTSTPTKIDEHVNPEFSILSAIGENNSVRTLIDDTLLSPVSSKCNRGGVKRKVGMKDYGDIIDMLDMKKAKMAGHYLDGCSVYITGFSPEHTEKLNKIINLSGATRYDTYSHRVTHIIVGSSVPYEDFEFIKSNSSPPLVTLHWLIDSIEQGYPVREEAYLLSISELESNQPGSPLSKKGLSLLRSVKTVTEQEMDSVSNVAEDNEDHARRELVQQYLNPGSSTCEDDTLARLIDNANFSKKIPSPVREPAPPTEESSISVTQNDSEATQIFQHLKFILLGFNDEELPTLSEKVASLSGEVVTRAFKGIPDFVVVPIFNTAEVHHTATEIVSDLFIFECEQKQELIKEILYYHRPFQLPLTKPLQNCVITLTCYHGAERMFLRSLIEGLGGVAQEQFARVTSEAKGVTASTHLVSPEATGKKYEAALKWSLPVIGKEWLIECARTGQYIPEEEFLVGEAKAPKRKNCVSSTLQSYQASNSDQTKSSTLSFCDTSNSTRDSKVLTPPILVKTPFSKRCLDSAEKPFSQVTPISKIMQNFRDQNLDVSNTTLKEHQKLQPWMNMKTPDTPLGACLTPNPSPNLKKQWAYWLTQFSGTPPPKSNNSTPLSDIKKRLWSKCLSKEELENDSVDSKQELENDSSITNVNENFDRNLDDPQTPRNETIASRLELLEQMLSSSAGKKRQNRNLQSTTPVPAVNCAYKHSQPCTVGWDYDQDESPGPRNRIFSLSGINEDRRITMVEQIESLGGSVSDLSNYDPACTHLLCPKPARNEKALSCMASGKWVLHVSYLEKSIEAGRFLNEEEYEFGNPKSLENIPLSRYDKDDKETEIRMQQTYWWRKEISKRGYCAFNDMRALIVANKKESLVRVIEAGGGTVIDARPPFTGVVRATHCLLEQKFVQDFTVYIPLAKQGIYVVNTLYINEFLQNPNKDVRDCILPYFIKYYS